jgi:hypothetical protein
MPKMLWEFDPKTEQFYYVENGNKYRVKQLGIYANGVKDTCIVKGSDGEPELCKIKDAVQEEILGIPDGDIAFVKLERRAQSVIIFDVNPSTKPMLDFMCGHVPRSDLQSGKDFAMYGGDIYG